MPIKMFNGTSWVLMSSGSDTVVVTSSTVATTGNTNYIFDDIGSVTATLPSTCSVGTSVSFADASGNGFTLAQNSGQQIKFGYLSTTPGVSGEISSLDANAVLELVCVETDSVFIVVDSVGNFEVT